MEVNDDSQVWGNVWFLVRVCSAIVCVLCASTFMYPGLCFKHIQYVPWTCVCLEASSLSVPFVSVIMLVLGGLRPPRFIVAVNICFVCLFICLGSDANMTMCALDTRNDSKGDTNAVINVLLQFNSFFSSLILYFTTLHPVFSNDCFNLFLSLTGGVGHITTIQILKGQFTLNKKMCPCFKISIETYKSRNNASVTSDNTTKLTVNNFFGTTFCWRNSPKWLLGGTDSGKRCCCLIKKK